MKRSMPSDIYSFILSATSSRLPTSAVPAPPPAVQARHALLTDRLEPRESFLRGGDRVVIQLGDQGIRRAPRLLRGFAHDNMETDAERKGPAILLGHGLRGGDLLRNVFRRLAPCEVDVHVLGRDDAPGTRRASKIKRRVRSLLRRIEKFALLDSEMLMRLCNFLALHELAPDGQELVGDFVTFVMIEK